MPANTPKKSISAPNDGGLGAICVSILIYCWLGLWTALYFALVALPVGVALCLPRLLRQAFLRRVILGWGWLTIQVGVWPFIRVKRRGEAASSTPGIYVFNHRSGSDAFLVATLGQPMVQCVNGWPLRLPLLGFIARQAGYLDITRLSYEEAKQQIAEQLSLGVSVIDFPEGHRSGSSAMLPFRSGIFRMARELGVPLHPGCITGNEQIPNLHFRLKCGRITVRLLKEITPEAQHAFPNAYVLKTHVRAAIAAAAEQHE